MKRICVVASLLFISASLWAQPVTNPAELKALGLSNTPVAAPASAPVASVPVAKVLVGTNLEVETLKGAVLRPDATKAAAIHDNFAITDAWLVILVPVLLAILKNLVPKIPPSYLPIAAAVLGALLDSLTSYLTGNAVNPALGAILGSAGVGLREIVDQLKNPTPVVLNTPTPVVPIVPLATPPKP